MKTTLIRITPVGAETVLKALRKKNLPRKYLGMDQEGRILLEVIIEKEHEDFINTINQYLKFWEEFSQIIQQEFDKVVEKYNVETDKEMQELKKEWIERKEKISNEILA